MTERSRPGLIDVARAGKGDEQIAPLRLGERVRALRKAQNMSLAEAARKAGLARSTLSKIENEQMSPTFDAVRKLARGLGVTVPQLFTPPQEQASGDRMIATPRGAGRTHLTGTYEHELLRTPDHARMLPYRAWIRARDLSDFDGWVRHDGEEFLYVLSGDIRFFSEFHEPLDMHPGDSVYYDATMGHNIVSTGPEDAQVLWITSLP